MAMLDIKPKEAVLPKKEEPVEKEEVVIPIEETPTPPPHNKTNDDADKEQMRMLQAKKVRQKKVTKIITGLFIAVIIFMITTAYSQYQVYVLKKLAAANALAHPDIPTTPAQIMEAVSRHILLPEGAPQIAAVQDAKKLSTSQAFFKDAANGDVVLVYDAMIILYRPSKDLIIAVGDIQGIEKQ